MRTIDTFGRRNLLLCTMPLMALCLFFTGFSFCISDATHHTARIACITLGIYLFGVVYSPGAGPVPFTYSAEAYPLYVRAYGMSLATATTWFFNFVLAITWPSLRTAFRDQGAFSWYAAWNLVGWLLVLLFVPETRARTLEELDAVFGVPTRAHAAYGARQVPYFVRRYVLRRKRAQPPRLLVGGVDVNDIAALRKRANNAGGEGGVSVQGGGSGGGGGSARDADDKVV